MGLVQKVKSKERKKAQRAILDHLTDFVKEWKAEVEYQQSKLRDGDENDKTMSVYKEGIAAGLLGVLIRIEDIKNEQGLYVESEEGE